MDGPLWLVTLEHAPCWSHSDGCGSWSPQMRNIRGIRSHETLEGVAGRPPAEIRGVRVPHACPECDSCRSAVCKVCVVRDLCCVQGLPLPHPAILPTL